MVASELQLNAVLESPLNADIAVVIWRMYVRESYIQAGPLVGFLAVSTLTCHVLPHMGVMITICVDMFETVNNFDMKFVDLTDLSGIDLFEMLDE